MYIMYIHTHINTYYLHMYIHTCIPTYIHTYIHAYISATRSSQRTSPPPFRSSVATRRRCVYVRGTYAVHVRTSAIGHTQIELVLGKADVMYTHINT